MKTFVFTDIVGSVLLKGEMEGRTNRDRDEAFVQHVLGPHRQRIDAELAERGGRVVSPTGDGFLLVFDDTIHASLWAISVQESHQRDPITTPAGNCVEVKIAINAGTAADDPNNPGNFIGKPVDYTARLVDLADGGQILVSMTVGAIVREAQVHGVALHSHGTRELRGIGVREVHELLYADKSPQPLKGESSLHPRGDTSDARLAPTGFHQRPGAAGGGVAVGSGGGQKLKTAPQKLGNYQLERLLGGGGMGDVYLARHVGMKRVCAVKVIREKFVQTGHEELISRFYREIHVAGKLKHPNIVVAYDSSTPGEPVHYLVMEYIEGVSLDELVELCGPLDVSDACELIRQAALGLQCIYEHDLVHRDVKPSNLMLADDDGGGVVKILDLGLALLVDENEERLTDFQQGPMGTGMYMAPEQWESTSVDIRADIYGLGCTFYHLLSGRPPFRDSEYTQKHAHQHSRLPRIERSGSIPKPLWSVLQMMLAKKPEQRYNTPADVIAALEPFAAGGDVGQLYLEYKSEADVKTGKDRSDTASSHSPEYETEPLPSTRPASTKRQSKTRVNRSRLRQMPSWLTRRRLAAAVLTVLVVAVAAYLLLRPSPPVLDTPRAAEATRFVMTLPGLYGNWWFEEIPWFFPEMRRHVLGQMTVREYDELHQLAGEPDVGRFYDRLLNLCDRSLKAQQDGAPIASQTLIDRFNALRHATPYEEHDKQNPRESVWGSVAAALVEERSGEHRLTPGDWHLRFLLDAKMGEWDLAETAYRHAVDGYHTSNEPALKAQSMADRATVFYRLRKFNKAAHLFDNARRTIDAGEDTPLFSIYTLGWQGECRDLDPGSTPSQVDDCFDAADAIVETLPADHPLRAFVLQRRARALLEGWRLDKAIDDSQEAADLWNRYAGLGDQAASAAHRGQSTGRHHAQQAYFRCKQMVALARHFSGEAKLAHGEFQVLLDLIEKRGDRRYDLSEPAQKSWLHLRPNLTARRGDCELFGLGDARAALESYRKAAKDLPAEANSPRAPYLARIYLKAYLAALLLDENSDGQETASEWFEKTKALRGDLRDPQQEMVFNTYAGVTAGIDQIDGQYGVAALIMLIQEGDKKINVSNTREDRDDRQLLLFACEYLLQGRLKQPGSEKDRATIEAIRSRFIDKMTTDGNEGQRFADMVAQSVRKITAADAQ